MLALQAGLGESTDCSKALSRETVAKLGDAPTCQFKVSSELTVTLGSQATILPNGTSHPDVISVASNSISSASGKRDQS